MAKRGIRIEKPENDQPGNLSAGQPPKRLGFFFRLLLVSSFFIAVLSLAVIFLTLREHVVM